MPLGKERKIASYLFFVLILFASGIISFAVWASTMHINDFVRGHGKIVTSGQTRKVQHLEGGVVEVLHVREGQQVKKGQLLFTLNSTNAAADLNENKIALDAAKIKRLRLAGELKNFQTPVFPDQLNDSLMEIVHNETALFQSRKTTLEEKLNALNHQIQQKEMQHQELASKEHNLKSELTIAQKQLSILEKLKRTGAASDTRVLEAQANVGGFQTRISEISQKQPVLRSEIAELKNKISETKEDFRSKAYEELGTVEVNIKQLESKLASYDEKFRRTEITSPVDGIINEMYLNTIGGIIRPGDIVAEITPTQESLIVEAKISIDDREGIWNGLPVLVQINAYEKNNMGKINGTLTEISADSFQDEREAPYYRIRIELEPQDIGNDGYTLYPGMTCQVNILTGKRTIMDFILAPISKANRQVFGI